MLDLGGEWELREAIGETWRWYVAAPPPASLNNVAADAAAPGWTTATVPGSIVDALARAAIIPDPRRGFGSRAAEWTGSRSWVLRRRIELPADWRDAVLEFDGIDPGGRIFWDGVEVARVDGLYRPVRVRLDAAGGHVLAVVIDPVPPGVPQVGRTEDVRRHAPRLGYGWDFCPPFPHQGIWRPVRMRRGPGLSALTVSARVDAGRDGAGDGAGHDGIVRVRAAADGPVRVEVLPGAGRDPVTGEAVPDEHGIAALELHVPRPPLWHPGAPHLAEVRVHSGGHREVRRVGFRRIEWDAGTMHLRVNGIDVPLAGVNWAPADAQYGSVTSERLAHLLDVAVASGARLLRVWGGGLVESREFFEACDERGLLVWQEFSQSSSGMQSAPSEDAAYLAELEHDARILVAERTHHPSLVIWGGGNELEGADGPLATDESPALATLASVIAELDPDRAWLPTSPSGPVFHHRLTEDDLGDQHDVHGPWEYQGPAAQHTLADRGTFRAHTEFGVEGMANRRLWEHVVPAGRGEPADRSNPLHRHLGEWWDNAAQVQELFGGGLELEELRRASQWLQASGLATAVEADRRRWPRVSMVLPWQLAESYPNTWGTALVGFDGEPKPALAAVARAFARERVTLRTARTAWGGADRVTAEAWVWSEDGRPAGGSVELRVLDLAGETRTSEVWQIGVVGAPAAVGVLTAPVPEGPFLWRAIWRDADGAVIDDEVLLQTGDADLSGLRALPRTTLAVDARPGGWRVTNTGPVAAIGWGPRDVRPGDDPRLLATLGDPRPLLPGGSREVRLVSGDAQPGDLVVDAWNADALALPRLPQTRLPQTSRKGPA